MVACATVIEVGFCIMHCPIAVGIPETFAAFAGKSISTGISACTAVVDVGLGIDAFAAATSESFNACACAIDASAAFTAVGVVIAAM